MRAKPAWCRDNCPLGKNRWRQGFAEDSGTADAKLLCIWENPSADDVDKREAASDAMGGLFNGWLRDLGLHRSDVLIANTLRCADPSGASSPKGGFGPCRHWDDKINTYDPNIWGVTYNPSQCLAVPQWRLYVKRAIEMALMYRAEGRRPALLMGTQAMNAFLPHLQGGVGTWKCHFEEKNIGNRASEQVSIRSGGVFQAAKLQ
jgi:hypothetical protein